MEGSEAAEEAVEGGVLLPPLNPTKAQSLNDEMDSPMEEKRPKTFGLEKKRCREKTLRHKARIPMKIATFSCLIMIICGGRVGSVIKRTGPLVILQTNLMDDFKAALQAEIEAKKRKLNEISTSSKSVKSVKVADLERKRQEEYLEKQRALEEQRKVKANWIG